LAATGARVELTADPVLAQRADGLVVPGVGAFAACMDQLAAVGGSEIILRRVMAGKPILGICVGHQILFAQGVEHGIKTPGVGLFPGTVELVPTRRLPHMGWNEVRPPAESAVFAQVAAERFYFVHSYAALSPAAVPADAAVTWTTHEATDLIAAVEWGPVTSTQFHPEKSGPAGAALLRAWVNQLGGKELGFHLGGYYTPNAMSAFTVLPAVDMMQGQAVQLVQGVPGSKKVFGDPFAAAQRWCQAGAEWLHLVDLDAAFGCSRNSETAARIVAELDLKVELTGGIRDDASLSSALATGCARVNIGTAALERPDWAAQAVAAYPDRVAIALDVKDGQVAARGWTTQAGEIDELIDRLTAAGCRRFVVTDVDSDGTLGGPNLELLRHVAERTPAQVTASGGIARLDDLRALLALAAVGVDSAIVGTALYLGAFTLPEALAAVAGDA
jgi:phosphoribosylanthranilate isomerase